ncbi:hypothetical protein EDD15DRAFT_2197697 [Pisolithus albus]|nr:hypothetical protein EDD15DRAFT_2197697 [Pisolithus albus]
MPHHDVVRWREESFSASATGNYSRIQRPQYTGVEQRTGSVLEEDPSNFGDVGDSKKLPNWGVKLVEVELDLRSIPVQSIEAGDDCELQLRFYGKKGERLPLTWVLTPEVAAIPPQLTQPRAGAPGHRKTSAEALSYDGLTVDVATHSFSENFFCRYRYWLS